MRYISLLVVLLLSLPTWAKTVPGQMGKSRAKLTPQQVQFMRWWRAQTGRVARPAKPATKPKLTIKVTRKPVKVVRIKVNHHKRVVVPVRKAQTSSTNPHRTSLHTLKAVLFKSQAPSSGVKGNAPALTVVRVRRRVVRRDEEPSKREAKRKSVQRAAKQLVIVQQLPPPSEPAPPPPSTLTTLRYQLELAQME